MARHFYALLLTLAFFCVGSAQAIVYHSGEITTDETWVGNGEVHVLQGHVYVRAGATLTIAPGAIVKPQSRYVLYVTGGRLVAQGQPSNHVVFTSYKDDTAGGDTNGDGSGSQPLAGDWYRLDLADAVGSRIDYCEFRYGGYSSLGLVRLYNTVYSADPPSVSNSTFMNSATDGIYLDGAAAVEPSIISCDFSAIGSSSYAINANSTTLRATISQNIIDAARGIYVRGASTVQQNLISNATDWAIRMDGSGAIIRSNATSGDTHYGFYANDANSLVGELTNNDFCGVGVFPARVAAEDVRWLTSNSLVCEDAVGYEVVGGTLATTATWNDLGKPYVLTGTHITIPADRALDIEEGTIFKFRDRLVVYAYGPLRAIGTDTAPIIWTSFKDDSVGGDTNQDGNLTSPAPADWYQIRLQDAVNAKLNYCDFRYAGYGNLGSIYMSYSTFTSAPPEISHCNFSNSSSYGIYYTGGASIAPEVSFCTFSDLSDYAIYGSSTAFRAGLVGNQITASRGIYLRGPAVARNNTITDASEWAFRIAGSGAVVDSNTTLGSTGYALYVDDNTYTLQSFDGNNLHGTGPFPLRVAAENVNSINANAYVWTGARGFECLGGTIDSNISWNKTMVPVVVLDSHVTIDAGATLTINPGAIVKWRDQLVLYVNGRLDAVGTEAEPIIFTSYKDDTAGGDTNGDGSATQPSPGDWYQVRLQDSINSHMRYCDLRYGGAGNIGLLYLTYGNYIDTPPIINDCVFSHSSSHGIYYTGGAAIEPLITDNVFADNSNYAIYGYSTTALPTIARNAITGTDGIYVRSAAQILNNTITDATNYAFRIAGSGADITNNTTQGNTNYAVYVDDGDHTLGSFSGNSFAGTGAYPLRLHADDMRKIALNSISGWTGALAFKCTGGTLTQSATWPVGMPIQMEYTHTTVAAGDTLTLPAGSALKYRDRLLLYVRGTLIADGTPGAPVYFTSAKDDAVGGDTNGDGNATTPAPGDWYRIQFEDSPGSLMDNVHVLYGGYSSSGAVRVYHTLWVDPAPKIQNCTISQSSTQGIYLDGGSASVPTVAGNTIDNCSDWAIHSNSTTLAPNITDNVIDGARGIYVRGPSYIARNLVSNASDYAIRIGGSGCNVASNATNGSTNYALYVDDGAFTLDNLSNNTFGGSGVWPLRLHADDVRRIAANTITYPNLLGFKVVGGTLSTDAVWHAGVPLVIQYTNVTVPDGVTLTMEPGTIVKFDARVYFYVYGQLLSDGTGQDSIYFTSYKDDSAGGDTNNDGTTTSPAPGDWYRIQIQDAPGSRLTRTVVRYAGYNNVGAVRLYDSITSTPAPVVQNCTIENSASYGIYVDGGGGATPDLSGNSFTGCGDYAIYANTTTQLPTISQNQIDGPRGVYTRSNCSVTQNAVQNATDWAFRVAAGAPTLNSNTTSGSTGYAVFCDSGTAFTSFAGNTFNGTGLYPLRIPVDEVRRLPGNTINWPGALAIELFGGTIATSATWYNTGLPYIMLGASSTVNAGVTLTLDAGVILKWNRYAMTVNGSLICQGNAANPVVFTSYRDDDWGGDSNNDGNASQPAAGDWYYLYFPNSAASGQIAYTRFLYGGYSNGYTVYARDNDLTMTDSVINHGTTYGLYLYNSSGNITRTTLRNQQYGAYCTAGSATRFNRCNIDNNSTYGLYNADAGLTVNAAGCWWGSDTGPYHASSNPTGQGNAVSDYVTYAPWSNFEFLPDDVVVDLTSFQSIVPRGGSLDFREVIANTSTEAKSFQKRFLVYNGVGQLYYQFPPVPVNLAPEQSQTTIYTLTVPGNVPVDFYTLESYLYDGPTHLDSDSIQVQVIEHAPSDPERVASSASAAVADDRGAAPGGLRALSSGTGGGSARGSRGDDLAGIATTRSVEKRAPVARWTLTIESRTFSGGSEPHLESVSVTVLEGEPVSPEAKAEALDAARELGLVPDDAGSDSPQDQPTVDENRSLPTPRHFGLAPAAPNPFNPRTTLRFALTEASYARLVVYDSSGRRVATLLEGERAAGEYAVTWDGRNDQGRAVPSGVYHALLEAGENRALRRLLLVK